MAGNPFDKKGGSTTATKSKGFAVANGDGDPIPAARDPFAVPGGGASDYKFTDFLRIGVPLNLSLAVICSITIPMIYPL